MTEDDNRPSRGVMDNLFEVYPSRIVYLGISVELPKFFPRSNETALKVIPSRVFSWTEILKFYTVLVKMTGTRFVLGIPLIWQIANELANLGRVMY